MHKNFNITDLSRRIDEFVHAAGFCTKSKKYPFLISATPDTTRAKGTLVLTVWVGDAATPLDFDREIDNLKTYLNGIIADLSFGETTSFIRFILIPN